MFSKLPTLSILLGLLITSAWVGFGIYLGVTKQLWLEDLNIIGDFAAGWFAPPAFFWLVMGYFRQGAELRNQANELALTREEIKVQSEPASKRLEMDQSEELRRRFKDQLETIKPRLEAIFAALRKFSTLHHPVTGETISGFELASSYKEFSPLAATGIATSVSITNKNFYENHSITFFECMHENKPYDADDFKEKLLSLYVWDVKMGNLSEIIKDNRYSHIREQWAIDVFSRLFLQMFPSDLGSSKGRVFGSFDEMIHPGSDDYD